jgi:hypothetical protein
MKYPYRIKLFFGEKSDKLKVIRQVNQFILYSSKGQVEKWNIQKNYIYSGIELAFTNKEDAVLFKLGFANDQEKLESASFDR